MDPFLEIREKIITDTDNLEAFEKGHQPVYSASASAKIIIVGQAPGRIAQATKKPWNDVSGIRLRQWLNMDEDTFYDESLVALIPMDFYYPGKGVHGDLPPRPGFAQMWHPLLLSQMPDVRLIVLVGRYAQSYYLKDRAKRTLAQTVEAYEDYLPDFFPIVHPSPLNFRWRAQNSWFEEDVVPHLKAHIEKIIIA